MHGGRTTPHHHAQIIGIYNGTPGMGRAGFVPNGKAVPDEVTRKLTSR